LYSIVAFMFQSQWTPTIRARAVKAVKVVIVWQSLKAKFRSAEVLDSSRSKLMRTSS
jgi:hypothetical protein